MNKMHVKTGDTVVVISGKNKGKKGKVLKAFPEANRVIVESVNMATMHKKPTKDNPQGGIVKVEAPIHASNVLYFCENCKKAVRLATKVQENGTKARICSKCKTVVD